MGLDQLYGFSTTFGEAMKDPQIENKVNEIKTTLSKLNQLLLELASTGASPSFSFERDATTNAVSIKMATCTELIDYLKD